MVARATPALFPNAKRVFPSVAVFLTPEVTVPAAELADACSKKLGLLVPTPKFVPSNVRAELDVMAPVLLVYTTPLLTTEAMVGTVPEFAGRLIVRSELVTGGAMVTVPVPDALA
jgi:hypothetical protein